MAPMSPCTTKAGCARSRTRAECPRVQCTAFAPRSVCVSRRGAMGEIVFLLDATRAKRNAKLTYFQCAAHETASRCYTALFCSSHDCTNCGLCLAVHFPSPSTIHMTTSPLAVS